MAFYASPSGSGDGLSAGSPGSIATVRALARDSTGPQTIFLRGGSYDFTAGPLVLDAQDSGVGGEILWRAYPGELPIFEAGRQVTGWVLHDAPKNIWRADIVPGTLTRQLWVNGTRAERVRGSAALAASLVTSDGGFTYVSNDPAMPVFARPEDLELALHANPAASFSDFNWLHDRLVAASALRIGNSTTLTMNATMVPRLLFWDLGRRWRAAPQWIENAYEFLDATTKGSWYHDAGANRVYYVPLDGEDMATADVWIPGAEQIIAGSGLSDVAFEGIAFRHTSWNRPITDKGYVGRSVDGFIGQDGVTRRHPAAVALPDSTRVRIRRCLFEHLGGAGIDCDGANADLVVRSNIFRDISARAVLVGRYDGPMSTGTTVRSNRIEDGSAEYMTDVVGLGPQTASRINHNDILRAPYIAIGLHDDGSDLSDNEWSNNRIVDAVQTLGDGGPLDHYNTNSPIPTTRCRITGNAIVTSRVTLDITTTGGIYLDSGSKGIDVHDNVVRCPAGMNWLRTQAPGLQAAEAVVSGNYASTGAGAAFEGTGSYTPPTFINGTDPAGWPAGAQAIWNAAGLDPEDADLLTYADGAPILFGGDAVAPVVTGFTVPSSPHPSTTVDVTVTATDAVGVTGYAVTVDTTDLPGAWEADGAITLTLAEGEHTLRAYARDAAGNVSAASVSTITVALAAVGVTLMRGQDVATLYLGAQPFMWRQS